MAMEGAFHEIPRAASRQISSSLVPDETENYYRRCIVRGRQGLFLIRQVFSERDCLRLAATREQTRPLVFTRIFDSGFLAVLNIDRVGRAAYDLAFRECFATRRFHLDTPGTPR